MSFAVQFGYRNENDQSVIPFNLLSLNFAALLLKNNKLFRFYSVKFKVSSHFLNSKQLINSIQIFFYSFHQIVTCLRVDLIIFKNPFLEISIMERPPKNSSARDHGNVVTFHPSPDEKPFDIYIFEFKLDPIAASRNFAQAKMFLINLLQSSIDLHMGDLKIDLHSHNFFFHEVSNSNRINSLKFYFGIH